MGGSRRDGIREEEGRVKGKRGQRRKGQRNGRGDRTMPHVAEPFASMSYQAVLLVGGDNQERILGTNAYVMPSQCLIQIAICSSYSCHCRSDAFTRLLFSALSNHMNCKINLNVRCTRWDLIASLPKTCSYWTQHPRCARHSA